MGKINLVNPANLVVGAADLALAPAFHPGPGGGGAAAIRTRAAMANLRFLSLVSVNSLEDEGSALPWRRVARLIGWLGPLGNQAARGDEVGMAQKTARALTEHLGGAAAGDALMADRMVGLLDTAALPAILRPARLTDRELTQDREDSLQYRKGTAEARRPVEERRLGVLGPRCAYALSNSLGAPPSRCPASAPPAGTAPATQTPAARAAARRPDGAAASAAPRLAPRARPTARLRAGG
jgi:hypothetical protein